MRIKKRGQWVRERDGRQNEAPAKGKEAFDRFQSVPLSSSSWGAEAMCVFIQGGGGGQVPWRTHNCFRNILDSFNGDARVTDGNQNKTGKKENRARARVCVCEQQRPTDKCGLPFPTPGFEKQQPSNMPLVLLQISFHYYLFFSGGDGKRGRTREQTNKDG